MIFGNLPNILFSQFNVAAAAVENKANEKRDPVEADPKESLLENFIGFQGNASTFTVFAGIRAAILEAETKNGTYGGTGKWPQAPGYICSCKLADAINCRCHHLHGRKLNPKTLDSDSEDSEETTQRELVQKVPQIVGAGLRSMFELISESKQAHPEICTRALYALLDVIQGQQPESFTTEPNDLIDHMYDLLLDLATYNKDGADSYSWSAVAASALIGLCVSRGDTGKTLKAIAAMLMKSQFTAQPIRLPAVLSTLQRSVIAVALNRPTVPDILHNGIPMNSELGSFSVTHPVLSRTVTNLQPAVVADGKYLYLLYGKALFKIGSGFGGTLKGHVYVVNENFGKDANGWLGYANVRRRNVKYRDLSS